MMKEPRPTFADAHRRLGQPAMQSHPTGEGGPKIQSIHPGRKDHPCLLLGLRLSTGLRRRPETF